MRKHTTTRVLSIVILSGVLAFFADAFAQTNAIDRSPAETVKRYLSLDAKGVRLDSTSFDTLRPYIDWKEEPVWGRVVMIQSYAVPEDVRQWEVISNLEVVIPVEFQVLGVLYLQTGRFTEEKTIEPIKVHLKGRSNRWRIVEPMFPPHVGPKRLLNYVRQAAIQEPDPDRRARLVSLQDELRKVK